MAAEASPNVNGVYESQYNQPAELAASTPAHSATNQIQAASSSQQKADPQEIGWYFVEQYYTTLSKTPERIHLFYSKKSQLVTGTEAEKVVPCVGSKAISEKIKSLDIQDCKVRVLNVDSQSSFDNIVVQVIGELSNKSQPHHKFVQTFVLATQPNGYFVLNDIFRYLNDEEDEIIKDQPAEEVISAEEDIPEPEETSVTKAVEEVVEPEAIVSATEEKTEESSIQSSVVGDEDINGVNGEEDTEILQPESTLDEKKVEPATVSASEQSTGPESTPIPETATKPAYETAPAKLTWANMVGTKATSIPALPNTTAPTSQPKVARAAQPAATPKATTDAASASSATPASTVTPATDSAAASASAGSSAATQNNGWQTADHSKKTKSPQQKTGEGIVHAYIKNVTEKVDARILREVLEKFGELKYFDVSRPRNCAFVEFVDPAGYAAAVAANPHDVGGEQISVEERRPRPGQYNNNAPNFNRGGSNAARGRGGLQNRSGSQGGFQKENRGPFSQRGAPKSGNITPKGKGQTQAA